MKTRRSFLDPVCLGAAVSAVPGAFAEALIRTPRQTEGPFYPDHLPLDTDNDLLLVNDALTPAVGEVTYLSGRILADEKARASVTIPFLPLPGSHVGELAAKFDIVLGLTPEA